MKAQIVTTLTGVAAGIALMVGMGACLPDEPPTEPTAPVSTDFGPDIVLPACITEEYGGEFPDCYWDAPNRGNGQGDSFIIWQGNIYYSTGE